MNNVLFLWNERPRIQKTQPLASFLLEGYKVIGLWGDDATGEVKSLQETNFSPPATMVPRILLSSWN